MSEEIIGSVEQIVFSVDSFTVARLKEVKTGASISIVGAFSYLQPGEKVRCSGRWNFHPQYGRQFQVDNFILEAPSDLVGIEKYLNSGLIKGIGPIYAKRIVDQFGTETLQIIDLSPERLLEIPGIGSKRAELIQSCWQQQRSIRDVMVFLQAYGITPAYAQKIYKTYGQNSIKKVQENPYMLARHVGGIGFKMADQIAQKMGVAPTSSMRLRAGIEHRLWECSNEGHTCYPEEQLILTTSASLDISPELLVPALRISIEEGMIVQRDKFISLFPLDQAEEGISQELKRLQESFSSLRKIDKEKAIEWAEYQLNISLAAEQKIAIGCAIEKKVEIITGGPGTGKSTITRVILKISQHLTDRIIFAAPTGRAAKRITEITQRKAYTIHSLLEFDFKQREFKRNHANPIDSDLLIIDEASMIDTFLFYHLLKAVPSTSRLILIGDVDQLPSVGAGNILKDLINSGKISVTRLTQVYRQSFHSHIITNAHLINQGQFPLIAKNSDFIFIEKEKPEEILSSILDLVGEQLPQRYHFDPKGDIQVLAPMKRGIIGTEQLNRSLQQILNRNRNCITHMGRSFQEEDKVMQIRNNYEKLIFNGDIGTILKIDGEEESITVCFEERKVEYRYFELEELILAYAVSIHKYQGSEAPCVIVPIHISHFKMLHRNLLYTAITRGRKLVVLVGTKQAIHIAIKNDEVQKRFTQLIPRIVNQL